MEGCVYVSRGGGRDDVCVNVCLSFHASTSRRGVGWSFTGQKYKSGQLSGELSWLEAD